MRIIDFKVENVTFDELGKALSDIGFQNKSDSKFFRYALPDTEEIVLLRIPSDTNYVDKINLASTAYTLAGRGVIKNMEFLERLLEKNRLLAENLAG